MHVSTIQYRLRVPCRNDILDVELLSSFYTRSPFESKSSLANEINKRTKLVYTLSAPQPLIVSRTIMADSKFKKKYFPKGVNDEDQLSAFKFEDVKALLDEAENKKKFKSSVVKKLLEFLGDGTSRKSKKQMKITIQKWGTKEQKEALLMLGPKSKFGYMLLCFALLVSIRTPTTAAYHLFIALFSFSHRHTHRGQTGT